MFAALLILLAVGGVADATAKSEEPPAASYVGSAVCASCHSAEAELWQTSPHALALRAGGDVAELRDLAAPLVVRYGNAAGATLRGGDLPTVEVSEDGVPAGPYEIPLVLGGRFITQPLARLPDGRLQALPVGYDTERAQSRR